MIATENFGVGIATGTRCRQSPVRGLVGALVFCAFLIGFTVLLWYHEAHWLAWGGCAAVSAMLVPWFTADAVAKFGSANWLLRLGPDGLWINLRSYMNRHLPEVATVVYLPYEEIASARRQIETWTTPSEPNSLAGRHWKRESLELSVSSSESREIAQVLKDERMLRGGIKDMHQAVTVPAASVIQIAWRGHGNDVAPPLARVLDELTRRTHVMEEARTDRGDWRTLSDVALDELVSQLVRSGDNLEAVQLLVRRRGCSQSNADNIVEDLARSI